MYHAALSRRPPLVPIVALLCVMHLGLFPRLGAAAAAECGAASPADLNRTALTSTAEVAALFSHYGGDGGCLPLNGVSSGGTSVVAPPTLPDLTHSDPQDAVTYASFGQARPSDEHQVDCGNHVALSNISALAARVTVFGPDCRVLDAWHIKVHVTAAPGAWIEISGAVIEVSSFGIQLNASASGGDEKVPNTSFPATNGIVVIVRDAARVTAQPAEGVVGDPALPGGAAKHFAVVVEMPSTAVDVGGNQTVVPTPSIGLAVVGGSTLAAYGTNTNASDPRVPSARHVGAAAVVTLDLSDDGTPRFPPISAACGDIRIALEGHTTRIVARGVRKAMAHSFDKLSRSTAAAAGVVAYGPGSVALKSVATRIVGHGVHVEAVGVATVAIAGLVASRGTRVVIDGNVTMAMYAPIEQSTAHDSTTLLLRDYPERRDAGVQLQGLRGAALLGVAAYDEASIRTTGSVETTVDGPVNITLLAYTDGNDPTVASVAIAGAVTAAEESTIVVGSHLVATIARRTIIEVVVSPQQGALHHACAIMAVASSEQSTLTVGGPVAILLMDGASINASFGNTALTYSTYAVVVAGVTSALNSRLTVHGALSAQVTLNSSIHMQVGALGHIYAAAAAGAATSLQGATLHIGGNVIFAVGMHSVVDVVAASPHRWDVYGVAAVALVLSDTAGRSEVNGSVTALIDGQSRVSLNSTAGRYLHGATALGVSVAFGRGQLYVAGPITAALVNSSLTVSATAEVAARCATAGGFCFYKQCVVELGSDLSAIVRGERSVVNITVTTPRGRAAGTTSFGVAMHEQTTTRINGSVSLGVIDAVALNVRIVAVDVRCACVIGFASDAAGTETTVGGNLSTLAANQARVNVLLHALAGGVYSTVVGGLGCRQNSPVTIGRGDAGAVPTGHVSFVAVNSHIAFYSESSGESSCHSIMGIASALYSGVTIYGRLDVAVVGNSSTQSSVSAVLNTTNPVSILYAAAWLGVAIRYGVELNVRGDMNVVIARSELSLASTFAAIGVQAGSAIGLATISTSSIIAQSCRGVVVVLVDTLVRVDAPGGFVVFSESRTATADTFSGNQTWRNVSTTAVPGESLPQDRWRTAWEQHGEGNGLAALEEFEISVRRMAQQSSQTFDNVTFVACTASLQPREGARQSMTPSPSLTFSHPTIPTKTVEADHRGAVASATLTRSLVQEDVVPPPALRTRTTPASRPQQTSATRSASAGIPTGRTPGGDTSLTAMHEPSLTVSNGAGQGLVEALVDDGDKESDLAPVVKVAAPTAAVAAVAGAVISPGMASRAPAFAGVSQARRCGGGEADAVDEEDDPSTLEYPITPSGLRDSMARATTAGAIVNTLFVGFFVVGAVAASLLRPSAATPSHLRQQEGDDAGGRLSSTWTRRVRLITSTCAAIVVAYFIPTIASASAAAFAASADVGVAVAILAGTAACCLGLWRRAQVQTARECGASIDGLLANEWQPVASAADAEESLLAAADVRDSSGDKGHGNGSGPGSSTSWYAELRRGLMRWVLFTEIAMEGFAAALGAAAGVASTHCVAFGVALVLVPGAAHVVYHVAVRPYGHTPAGRIDTLFAVLMGVLIAAQGVLVVARTSASDTSSRDSWESHADTIELLASLTFFAQPFAALAVVLYHRRQRRSARSPATTRQRDEQPHTVPLLRVPDESNPINPSPPTAQGHHRGAPHHHGASSGGGNEPGRMSRSTGEKTGTNAVVKVNPLAGRVGHREESRQP